MIGSFILVYVVMYVLYKFLEPSFIQVVYTIIFQTFYFTI